MKITREADGEAARADRARGLDAERHGDQPEDDAGEGDRELPVVLDQLSGGGGVPAARLASDRAAAAAASVSSLGVALALASARERSRAGRGSRRRTGTRSDSRCRGVRPLRVDRAVEQAQGDGLVSRCRRSCSRRGRRPCSAAAGRARRRSARARGDRSSAVDLLGIDDEAGELVVEDLGLQSPPWRGFWRSPTAAVRRLGCPTAGRTRSPGRRSRGVARTTKMATGGTSW